MLSHGSLIEATTVGSIDINGATLIDNSATVEASASEDSGTVVSLSGGSVNNFAVISAVATSDGAADAQIYGGAIGNSAGRIEGLATDRSDINLQIGSGGSAITNSASITVLATSSSTASANLDASGDITNSAGAMLTASASEDSDAGLTISGGSLTNEGTVEIGAVTAEASASISAGTIDNNKLLYISADADGSVSGTIDGGTITNGGTIATTAKEDSVAELNLDFVSGGDNTGTIETTATDKSSATTTISGSADFINQKTLTALAETSGAATLNVETTSVTNAGGVIGASANGDGTKRARAEVFIDAAGGIANSNDGVIEALATAGKALVQLSNTVLNLGGTLRASATAGGTAEIDLGGATISDGTLATTSGSAAIGLFFGNTGSIVGATVAANSNIVSLSGGTLTLSDVTFGKGDKLLASEDGAH